MSGRLTCRSPRSCGTTWHIPATAAAQACARGAGKALMPAPAAPPLPPHMFFDQEGHDERQADAMLADLASLRQDLARADAREGWSPGCGRVHPGGYDDRALVVTDPGAGSREGGYVLTYTRSGREHRTDGPARTVRSANYVTKLKTTWMAEGQVHRGDGPSGLHPGHGEAAYHWRGEEVGNDASKSDSAARGRARLDKLVSFGADPDTVVGWLAWEKQAGRKGTRALIRAGALAPTAAACASAKVLDVETVMAVHRGDVPLGWAAAGVA